MSSASRRALTERPAGLHLACIILDQLAIATEPCETLFHNPAMRLNAEAVRAQFVFHNLEIPAVALLLASLRQFRTSHCFRDVQTMPWLPCTMRLSSASRWTLMLALI